MRLTPKMNLEPDHYLICLIYINSLAFASSECIAWPKDCWLITPISCSVIGLSSTIDTSPCDVIYNLTNLGNYLTLKWQLRCNNVHLIVYMSWKFGNSFDVNVVEIEHHLTEQNLLKVQQKPGQQSWSGLPAERLNQKWLFNRWQRLSKCEINVMQ